MWLTWLVPDRIAAGGMPYPAAGESLADEGIGAVVSLTTRPPAPESLPPGVRHLHLPVPDMTPPRPEQMREAISFIRSCLSEDRKVLVHCGAGLGRTGTILAGWLVAEGMDPEEAMERVRRARPGSIETPEQEEAVRDLKEREDPNG